MTPANGKASNRIYKYIFIFEFIRSKHPSIRHISTASITSIYFTYTAQCSNLVVFGFILWTKCPRKSSNCGDQEPTTFLREACIIRYVVVTVYTYICGVVHLCTNTKVQWSCVFNYDAHKHASAKKVHYSLFVFILTISIIFICKFECYVLIIFIESSLYVHVAVLNASRRDLHKTHGLLLGLVLVVLSVLVVVSSWHGGGLTTHYYWCFHHNFHPRWRRLVLPLYLSLSRVLVCLSSTRRVLSFGDGAANAKCVRKSRPCRASRWKCVLRMRRGVVGVVDFIAATSCWFTWFIHFTVSWTHSHIYTHTRLRHTQQRWVCLGELWKSRSALTSRRLRTWFLVGYNMGLFMLCIEMRMPTICLANMK